MNHSHKTAISVILPVLSVIILASFFMTENTITGYVVLPGNDTLVIDADVVLVLDSLELIPIWGVIRVSVDEISYEMPIIDFLEKSGKSYEIENGGNPSINYAGKGIIGSGRYVISLSEFTDKFEVKPGIHTLKTEILYGKDVLYSYESEVQIQ